MEITEFEKKRAANLIWNRVYDLDGKADVYWNSIIGAIHLHYDWKKLMLFYNTFHEKIEQGTYESLFWLAMENAAFLKEKDVRPVFPYLRSVYARKKVEELRGQISEDHAGQRLLAITLGHFRRAMGEDAGLPDLVDIHLLDEIEIGPELTTDEIIEHRREGFARGQEDCKPFLAFLTFPSQAGPKPDAHACPEDEFWLRRACERIRKRSARSEPSFRRICKLYRPDGRRNEAVH